MFLTWNDFLTVLSNALNLKQTENFRNLYMLRIESHYYHRRNAIFWYNSLQPNLLQVNVWMYNNMPSLVSLFYRLSCYRPYLDIKRWPAEWTWATFGTGYGTVIVLENHFKPKFMWIQITVGEVSDFFKCHANRIKTCWRCTRIITLSSLITFFQMASVGKGRHCQK